jgi:DNA-binding transcriptional LysR family regulator
VEPTVYGRALIKRGVAAFDELRQGVKEIEFLTDPTAGELRIGTTETMSAGLIPAVIEPLSEQYPAVVFHVSQAPGVAQQYRDLRERNVELVLGRMATPADEDLDAEVLIEDPLCIVAGIQNPWVGRNGIELADLVGERWILPQPDSVIGSLVAAAFRGLGLDLPRTAVVSNSLQLENALLASGRYLGFFPASLIRFSETRLMIAQLPVTLPVQPPPVGIVTLKNRTISPVARLFIDCARAVVKPFAPAS